MVKRLEELDLPEDIKKLDTDELELLAVQLREKLIDTVSETGGHLASNLGVVELTLALHRCFDTSKDRIIFDVGHQSYVHKMLTGRLDRFSTLRKLDGLSGFPKVGESIHDAFDTGHSSTSISAAYGMAAARDLKKEKYDVVAVIGDGSLTGGLAYEGLNNLGNADSKAIVILNDNGMSIRPNTGGISDHLAKLRVSKGYYKFKTGLKRSMRSVPGVGEGIVRGASKLRDVAKYALVDGVFFEELGFTYIGPIDGHDIDALTEALMMAKNAEESCLVHVLTTKGKGYRNAEIDPDVFHGTGPFEKTTGLPKKTDPKMTYSDLFGMTMTEMAERDDKIVSVSAAMIDGVGMAEFAKEFPERTFDAGIAEQHAVTFAAGLAAAGMKPVVSIYSTFLERAYDQILMDVCLMDLPVVFAIDRAGIVGADGETHHGVFDLSYLTHLPNMKVLCPSGAAEMRQMLKYAVSCGGPCAVRYPKGHAHDPYLGEHDFTGKSIVIREGKDGYIIAAGSMVHHALMASDILKGEGLEIGVVDAAIVKPIDEETIGRICAEADMIFTCEDNVAAGGFGSAVSSFAAENYPGVRVFNIGWPLKFIEHGSIPELMHRYGMDGYGIAGKIAKAKGIDFGGTR